MKSRDRVEKDKRQLNVKEGDTAKRPITEGNKITKTRKGKRRI